MDLVLHKSWEAVFSLKDEGVQVELAWLFVIVIPVMNYGVSAREETAVHHG